MKKFGYLLPLALIATALAVPAASSAAPSPVHYTISSNAQYLSPTTIIVPVTLTCPTGLTAFVFVNVQEQVTNAIGSGFLSNFVCTGSAQSLAVIVNGFGTGPGFTPGKAYATGSGCAGIFCDNDARQIQINV